MKQGSRRLSAALRHLLRQRSICRLCHGKPPYNHDYRLRWIALLFVSAVGVVGTTVYGRKKKYSVK